MADAALKAQAQARANAEDLQSYMRDLVNWEKTVKVKDESLQKAQTISKSLPPVRNQAPRAGKEAAKPSEKKLPKSKGKAIPGGDFRAWDKFNVDDALQQVDSDGEDAVDAETEMHRARQLQEHLGNDDKEKGNAQFKKGKYVAAIECYSRGIEHDPYSAVIVANRAMAYLRMKKNSEAEVDCTTAIKLDAKYVKAWQRRATARTAMNKLELALIDYKQVIKLDPANKTAKQEIKSLPKRITEAKEKARQAFRPLEHVGDSTTLSGTRSTKVLHRIPIEEIGSSEDEEDSTTTNNNTNNIKNNNNNNNNTTTTNNNPNKISKPMIEDITTQQNPTTTTTTLPTPTTPLTTPPTTTPPTTSSSSPSSASSSLKHNTDVKSRSSHKHIKIIDESSVKTKPQTKTNPTPTPNSQTQTQKQATPPPLTTPTATTATTTASSSSSSSTTPTSTPTVKVRSKPSSTPIKKNVTKGSTPIKVSAARFETTWRHCQRDVSRLFDVLKNVKPSRLPTLIKQNMSAEMLSDFLRVVDEKFLPQHVPAFDYLMFLSQVQRFDQTVMFLEDEEVAMASRIFKTLSSDTSYNTIDRDELIRVGEAYGITM